MSAAGKAPAGSACRASGVIDEHLARLLVGVEVRPHLADPAIR
ncbi:hypothetical protein ACXJJ3_36580 [Kribbella sp. WER1]